MDDLARKFVVGLGNPGRKYAKTRHNVGFRVLETLIERWQLGSGRDAWDGLVWETRQATDAGEQAVTLLAPQTYMNRSGQSVRKMLDFYKATPAQLLVVYDEVALPLGRLRARPGGSDAGHNGLSDILRACGTQDVPRLRVGVGPVPGVMERRDFVLGTFRSEEVEPIGAAIELAADAVTRWIRSGLTPVMETYNSAD